MENSKANIRITELRGMLNEANRRYYIENSPLFSDYEFDMLLKELEALENEYPELITADSPTQRVGSDLSAKRNEIKRKEFQQYQHRYPMLSLGNTYDISEVQAFAVRVAKDLGNVFTYSCELKFDGTAICLTYKDGKLFRALTRGDGTIGDDVTENVRQIRNIPFELTYPQGFIPTQENPQPWPQEFEIYFI